ncbi:MAG: response regulator transcription factor [Planctomycetaceae bacterium]|jgi:two-component system phosphate regulon response regulator PhoB|nr:response regulator transcription factor [Planctomycetaceae bacterium]
MAKEQILVIEDEKDILSMVRLRLESRGFNVFTAESGELALQWMAEHKPDLILLDLMLPGISGLDVLKQIRTDRNLAQIPILIVSALGEENDVVVGLERGADDYLSKPFNMSVLMARVNALLRRSKPTNHEENIPNNEKKKDDSEDFIVIGTIRIDIKRYHVFVENKQVALTSTEYRLLLALIASKGRVLTRNQLIDEAIGNESIVTDRTIDVHLTSLRSKLGSARNLIETVRGVGYRFRL